MTTSTETKTSSLDNIVKLESPSEWISFKRDMIDYLHIQGYGRLLPGEDEAEKPEGIDGLTESEKHREQRSWKDKQNKALGCIRYRLGENPRTEISSDKSLSTLSAVWKYLTKHYRPKGSAVFQQLSYQWDNTTLTTEHTVAALAAKLRQIRTDFIELDKTCTISTPHLINKLLSALGPNYSIFLTTFYQSHSIIPERNEAGEITKTAVTFEETLQLTLQEEQNLRIRNNNGLQAGLLHAQRPNKPQGGKGKRKTPDGPQCNHCETAGRRVTNHSPDDCFWEHPEKAPSYWRGNKTQQPKRQKLSNNDTPAVPAKLMYGNNGASSDAGPAVVNTFLAVRDDTAEPLQVTPQPSILSRFFRGILPGAYPVVTRERSDKQPAAGLPAGLTANPTTLAPELELDGIPDGSSTGQRLMKLGLMSLPKDKAMELARKLQEVLVLDSGCSQTSCCKRELFSNLRPYKGPQIYGIGGKVLTPEHEGTISFDALIDGKVERINIQDAIYCPGLGANLISVTQLTKKGAEFLFRWNTAYGARGEHIFLTAIESAGLYVVDQPGSTVNIAGLNMALHSYSITDPDLLIWHERLGHLSEQNIRKLMTMSKGIKPLGQQHLCDDCVEGRHREKPHRGKLKKGTYNLESLHLDEAGMPQGTVGHDKSTGWLAIVCDKSQMSWVVPIKQPKDWLQAFKDFLAQWERPERRCHMVTIDKLGSHGSAEFQDFCRQKGIDIRYSATGQHEQNGVSESTIGHLKDHIRSTIRTAVKNGVPAYYWPIIVKSACYLRNRSPHSALETTPYEAWYGDEPDLHHLVKIGATGYYKLNRKTSILESTSVPCKMLGYSGDSMTNYVVLRLDNNTVINANNVTFKEKHLIFPQPQCHGCKRQRPDSSGSESAPKRRQTDNVIESPATRDSPAPRPTLAKRPRSRQERRRYERLGFELPPATTDEHIADPLPGTYPVTTRERPDEQAAAGLPAEDNPVVPNSSAHDDEHIEETVTYRGSPPPEVPHGYNLRPRTDHTQTSRYQLKASPEFHLAIATLGVMLIATAVEPRSYKQAKHDLQWRKWHKAMKDEHQSLVDNDTWTICDLPAGRKPLSGKWVYKLKRGPDGEITRHKARWVVRGFEQVEGLDYTDTFASVVKPMSYKAIFALAAALDLELEQMDVKTAFLYGPVTEEIYVEQPPEFDDGTGRVCKLNKALYGLKQAPRVWYHTLATFLKDQGFSPLESDIGVFSKGHIYIAVYVDDLLIAGPDKEEIAKLKKALSDRFEMSDLGPCNYYLGMSITRDRANKTIYLSQKAYLEKIIKELGQWDAHPNATPIVVNKIDEPSDDYEAPIADVKWYAKAIGCLMYAMMGTRPDIAYAVSYLSRYMKNPTTAHLNAVRRVLRYLKGTLDLKLTYQGNLHNLTGWTDSDWAGCTQSRRSTAGYIFNIGSGAISWSSKRQSTVALSSCEAEYMGQTQATKEAIWLRRLLGELNAVNDQMTATVIYGDNQGALALARNPQFHARTKHIEVHHHFAREKQASGEVDFQYTHTSDQIADGLTKPLPKDKFVSFREALGILP